jgi:hypothetical protein
VVVYKLVSARERDVLDITGIVKRQKSLDRAYLRKWADWWEKEGIAGIRKRLDSFLA